MLNIGIKGKHSVIVDKTNTAATLGSGSLEVFSTPAMVALLENTCKVSVNTYLEHGFDTVGISVNIKHIAATPIGQNVTCESELIEIDRKRLVFKVTIFDEKQEVGNGIHERFIVNSEQFLANINSK